MPKPVFVAAQAFTLDPSKIVGQGGEAVVYRFDKGHALKVFMTANDPAYAGDSAAMKGAERRIQEHQQKLPAFPTNLPPHVVSPTDLAYDKKINGQIAGYVMPYLDGVEPLLSYADKRFRDQLGIDANQVVKVFQNLYELVDSVHAANVVIGDFNDLNVLVNTNDEAFLVDADSMQFGAFFAQTFTVRFIDQLLCPPDRLVLVRPHNEDSDWYAFTTMLFQSLLFINPYLGTHRPKAGLPLRNDARVLNRVTVFSPDVIYPKTALPYSVLPDDILEHFKQVYEQDKRGSFPRILLEGLRWTSCLSCGLWHARPICPACSAPGVVKATISVRGSVTATRFFKTTGRILYANYQKGEVKYAYWEDGLYKREGGRVILKGVLDSELRVRIQRQKTIIAKGNRLAVVGENGVGEQHETELIGRLPIFDANSEHLYWVDNGRLVKDGQLGPVDVGAVLPNQTLLWVGQSFGFGFYRAGSLTRGLVFGVHGVGINDTVPLPILRGRLIDASCSFSDHMVWFMLSIADGGEIYHHCYVISDRAELLAQAQAIQGGGTWLGDGIRGRLALGQYLYVAQDSGIVRVVVSGRTISVDREFPDTEPFVDGDTQLLPGKSGITAVSTNEIVLLQIH